MSSHLDESDVEAAALEWFAELGYQVRHGPDFAPGEPAAERAGYGDVVLVGRLRAAVARINPSIPAEAREEAVRRVLRAEHPDLVLENQRFHRFLVDGVDVEYRRPDGSIAGDKVWLLNFDGQGLTTGSYPFGRSPQRSR